MRESGYEIACYSYANIGYGSASLDQINADLDKWATEVSPILGAVDTLVLARNSDISNMSAAYSGEKFSALQSYGFTHYLGFCTDGTTWFTAASDHIRQGRLMVTGSNLAHHADWFTGIFDPSTILDASRGNIPS